jgi:hypothetical protein
VNVWCSLTGDQLTGPFVLEQCLNADNYLNLIMNKLPLLIENMPLETRHRTFFKHNGVPSHLVKLHLTWISPTWFFLWGLMKEMYRTKVHMKEEICVRLWCCCVHVRIPTNGPTSSELVWKEQGCALKTMADILNCYKLYCIRYNNKFIWLIL